MLNNAKPLTLFFQQPCVNSRLDGDFVLPRAGAAGYPVSFARHMSVYHALFTASLCRLMAGQ